jgi:hypothetical protein
MSVYIHASPDMFRSKLDHLQGLLSVLGMATKNVAGNWLANYSYPPDVAFYIYIFSATISTEYFKHAAHSPFFSSKFRLFHNATFFGSCIIHILHTGCAKI